MSVFGRVLAAAFLCLIPASAMAGPLCQADGFDYMGTAVTFNGDHSAYFLASDTKIVDADGAPNAYHPADVPNACPDQGLGIDCLASAGYPGGSWWRTVLVADADDPSRPAVQQAGPYKGYFVSMTSLRNTAFGADSPASYVDAARTPYLVLPAPIYRTDGMGEMGDIGWAINLDTGRSTPFVIADEGPVEPFGEASVAFWRALGGTPNPRNGDGLPDGRIAYAVFPGSGHDAAIGWPIDHDALTRVAKARLDAAGGEAVLRACAGATASAWASTAQ